MHLDLEVGRCAQAADSLEGAEGFEDAERVGEAQAACSGPLRRLSEAAEEIHVGARGVLATQADFQPERARHRDHARQALEQPVAVAAQLEGEVLIGGWHRDIHQIHTETGAGSDVFTAQPAPDHQSGRQAEAGDGADRFALLLAHGGNADLEFRHADRGQLGGDRQLLVQRKRHTGRLLAVAQGGVVDDDAGSGGHGVLLALA